MNHWKAHKPYWVIDMNTDEGHGLVGRWYFEDGRRIPELPQWPRFDARHSIRAARRCRISST